MLSCLRPDDTAAWENFLAQVDLALPYLTPLARWKETLKRPKRMVIVDVPVRRDDGSIAHYEGYRVQHNTSRGPAKGGIRFHPDATLAEVMALAGWMTIKNAVVNLPYGGGKGAIRVAPETLSRAELERMTRRYTTEIAAVIGPDIDIPAPDVNTDASIMAWMMDTYAVTRGHLVSGVVTGKPLSLGGSEGRKEATGEGIYVVARDILARLGRQIAGQRVMIQGFGNVGGTAASFFHAAGARIVAVQDWDGAIYQGAGLDPRGLAEHRALTGSIRDFAGTESITREAFWSVSADLLIPAALENQITEERARLITASVIVEGANGPTLPDGEAALRDRGVVVVPDVLANAGGVITSYFEWVQDTTSFFWPETEVRAKLQDMLLRATEAVWACHLEHHVSLREAAYILGCRRVLEAREQRGLYP